MRALALALLVACGNSEAPEGPPPTAISQAEIQRGQDACKSYVEKVCSCADKVEAAKDACQKARPLPESLNLTLNVANATDTKPKDSRGAQNAARAIMKQCIEGVGKLPTLGCS